MSKPVRIEGPTTFNEMMKEVMEAAKVAEERYNKGLCTAKLDDGTQCDMKTLSPDGYCDHCREKINGLLDDLFDGSGLTKASIIPKKGA